MDPNGVLVLSTHDYSLLLPLCRLLLCVDVHAREYESRHAVNRSYTSQHYYTERPVFIARDARQKERIHLNTKPNHDSSEAQCIGVPLL
jgi:hypothetical protein